ncbi:MAG: hypothetical protein M4579_000309 [Chaenotheca gracillima]|nr:MAG: hypothetical protein M4579_000309 [Chaenotheca gracillima]
MADAAATVRAVFEPDGSSVEASAVRDELPPTSSGIQALARFEFESGRGNEGTKILMIEWESEGLDISSSAGDWHVSWPGKTTVLPANDQKTANDREPTRRFYFLLPPGAMVPPVITLEHRPSSAEGNPTPMSWNIKPLPAIFPPELGASARTAGKKGVLHTIWAKKRIAVLQKEISDETRNNIEGIGLEMAQQEKEWIEQHFGVSPRPSGISMPSTAGQGESPPSPQSPTSPRSPGGNRLAEKMKGLRVGTSAQVLAAQPGNSHQNPSRGVQDEHPLSPETSDVAISSFAAFHAPSVAPSGNKDPSNTAVPQRRTFLAQAPPASVLSAQQQNQPSLNSLGSVLDPSHEPPSSFRQTTTPPAATTKDDSQEDGLFAVAMSPRSPEMPKSPFSFSSRDTMARTNLKR